VTSWSVPDAEEVAGMLHRIFDLDVVFQAAAYRSGEQCDRETMLCSTPLALLVSQEGDFYARMSEFLAIPPGVFDAYFRTNSPEVAEEAYSREVLFPYFDRITEAFEILKPPGMPGWFMVDVPPAGGAELVYIEPMGGGRMAGLFDVFKNFPGGEKKPAPSSAKAPPKAAPAAALPVPPPTPGAMTYVPNYPLDVERIPVADLPARPEVFRLPGPVAKPEEPKPAGGAFSIFAPLAELLAPAAPKPAETKKESGGLSLLDPVAKMFAPAPLEAPKEGGQGGLSILDPFSKMLSPEKPKETGFSVLNPMATLLPAVPEQKSPGKGLVESMTEALAPEGAVIPHEPSVFDIWASQPKPQSFVEAVVPKGEEGSLYRPPAEIFPTKESEPPVRAAQPDREEPPQKVSKRKKAKSTFEDLPEWTPPTTEEMKGLLTKIFDLDALWEDILAERSDEESWSQQVVGVNEFGGDGARIELQTIADGSYGMGTYIEQMFSFFGLEADKLMPYVDLWMQEDADGDGEYGDAYEAMTETFDWPLRTVVYEAFEELKPKDIPGHFGIEEYHEGLMNIVYFESLQDLPKAERRRYEKLDREAQAREEKRYKEIERRRKEEEQKALLGWRAPSVQEMKRWFQDRYELTNLWNAIRAAKKTKRWREGGTQFVINDFGDEYAQQTMIDALAYFDVPHGLIEAVLELDDGHVVLNDRVLEPIKEVLESAFVQIAPKDLPGLVDVAVDDSGDLVFYYYEVEE
jgi:hypothetical protein